MRAYGFILALCISIASLSPALAAGGARHTAHIDWQQRDTAVYVVSTLNLLRSHNGGSLVSLLQSQDGVRHYAVYQDRRSPNRFFIRMKAANGSTVAIAAYEMGWRTPRAVSDTLVKLGVDVAPATDLQAFGVDPKVYLATFSSTVPW